MLDGSVKYGDGENFYQIKKGQAVLLSPGCIRSAQTKWMHCAAFSFLDDTDLLKDWVGVIDFKLDSKIIHYINQINDVWNTF